MSLAATFINDYILDYPSGLDAHEIRPTTHGLLMAANEMSQGIGSVITPELRRLASSSQGIEIDIPVMKRGNVTIKSTRTCDVQCGENESDLVRITWKTVVADICMVKAQYKVNKIGYRDDFMRKVIDMVDAFKTEMESDVEAVFETNKTQVYGSTIVGTDYPLVGGAIQVDEVNLDYFFGTLSAINFADDFNATSTKIIANHGLMPTVNRLFNQGGNNNTNLSYQFAGQDFRFTNGITNGAGVKATGYFMPAGSIGILTRTDVDAQAGHSSTRGTQWSEMMLPNFPWLVGVKYDSECSDQTALDTNKFSHLTATLVEHWQFSFDYAIITPYNSDPATQPGAIRKFELV